VLVRSDNMGSLNSTGQEAMVAYGVNSVIDLRSESEVAASPSPFALSSLPPFRGEGWGEGRSPASNGNRPAYLHLPLLDDASMLRVGAVPTMFDRYLMMLQLRQAAFGGIFSTFARAEGTLVFHCFAGKDRTGMVAAMSLALAGVDVDSIAADFAETDSQLAPRYEEWLAAATPEQRAEMREDLRCPPERIVGVLEHLERQWGGVEEYLGAAGVLATDITRLQSKLISRAP
jgi:protein-tyrosine phosphatase